MKNSLVFASCLLLAIATRVSAESASCAANDPDCTEDEGDEKRYSAPSSSSASDDSETSGAYAFTSADGYGRVQQPIELAPLPYLVVLIEPGDAEGAAVRLVALQRRLGGELSAHNPDPGVDEKQEGRASADTEAEEPPLGVIASTACLASSARAFNWEDIFTLQWAEGEAQRAEREAESASRALNTDGAKAEEEAALTPALRVLHALEALLIGEGLPGPLALRARRHVSIIYVGAQGPGDGANAGHTSEAEAHAVLGELLPALTANVSLTFVAGTSRPGDRADANATVGSGAPADWQTYIGASAYEDAYADGSGFNRALTLRQIIAAGEVASNTLQAHGLAQGLVVRVLPQEHWGSTPESMLTVAVPVPEHDHYIPLPAELGDGDQLPLMIEGADIGMSKDILGGRWSRQLARRRVSIVEDAPKENFIATLVGRNRPVVLRNGLPQLWDGLKQWQNLSHFAEKLDKETLENVKLSALHNGRFFDPDWTAPFAALPHLSRDTGFAELNISREAVFAELGGGSGRGRDGHQKEEKESETTETGSEVTEPHKAQEAVQEQEQEQEAKAEPYASQAGTWEGAPATTPLPPRLVYFSEISPGLHAEVKPDINMYLSSDDWMYRKQFVWVSSAGSNTHLHFDQDYNVFVQMVGRKRFTLFAPSQTPFLHPYPRAHPLWHKSRLDFDRPDLMRFPDYVHARSEEVELGPGDMLYVPPYYWHQVETLTTPSISLSTLSHDDSTRDAMSLIYKMDHKFDRLAEPRGQMFSLRLYLDLLLHEIFGNHPHETVRYFARLLNTRYRGLENLFRDEPSICDAQKPRGIPIAQHVYGDAVTDMKLVAPIFVLLSGEVRDTLLADYIEDLAAPVVGADRLYSFFRYCFQEDYDYYLTEMDTPEHLLWDHKIFHDIGAPAEAADDTESDDAENTSEEGFFGA